MKLFLLMVSACIVAFGQQSGEYVAQATTTALTIQQPASGTSQIQFRYASLSCASAQTATLSYNGTAATATAGTSVKLPGTLFPSSATVWTGSNVGAGTTVLTYPIPAGSVTYSFDLSPFKLGNGGTGFNLTISTTGSCTIAIAWGQS